MNINVFIVGYGSIGKELVRQVKDYGGTVRYIARSDGVYIFDPYGTLSLLKKWSSLEKDLLELDLRGVEIVFIATPPSPDGSVAKEYARLLARRHNIKLVTCDKSLIANYQYYMEHSGITATVGGGCHILPFLKEHIFGRTDVVVHLILNATLNFIMSGKESMDEAVAKAITENLTEPKAGGCLGTINNEIADTVLKTCIVANHCFSSERMIMEKRLFTPSDISVRYIGEDNLIQLRAEKNNRRYIVSFSRLGTRDEDTIGGFRFNMLNGWEITAGFKRLDSNPQFAKLDVPDANNAVVISKGKFDKYPCYLVGPGAGPEATVRTMMQDAKRLIGIY